MLDRETPVTVARIRAEINEAGNLALDPRWRELMFARVLRAIRERRIGDHLPHQVAAAALEILE